MKSLKVKKQSLFESLPPVAKEISVPCALNHADAASHKLIVLDDDPTGTQTVYGLPVLTEWSVESLTKEFANDLPCFYILTNSRSLPTEEAQAMMEEISRNLLLACDDPSRFTIVSRSDSTLRGHFPAETDVLNEHLGPFAATILIPYFEAGGRYTIHDTHYVQDGDELIPAAETPFAKDAVFGYGHSNLKDWVEEKSTGSVKASEVASLTLDCIRKKGIEGVRCFLEGMPFGAICVVNAAAPEDLDIVVASCSLLRNSDRRFLFRTGAQWVSAFLGMQPRILSSSELGSSNYQEGGLIVIGSYVPLSSQQWAMLQGAKNLEEIECSVATLIQSDSRETYVSNLKNRVQTALSSGRNVVLYTSRELLTGNSANENLEIGKLVSETLVAIVKLLEIRPRYLIAKGGITSSDIATKALESKRAMVAGQAEPGIPVWRLGNESKYPDMHYIVFPGNVGNPNTLLQIYQKLNP